MNPRRFNCVNCVGHLPAMARLEDIKSGRIGQEVCRLFRSRGCAAGQGNPSADYIARIRALLAVSLIPIDAIKAANIKPEEPKAPEHPCPCCGSRMRIIETFLPGQQPKHRPTPLPRAIRIDTS